MKANKNLRRIKKQKCLQGKKDMTKKLNQLKHEITISSKKGVVGTRLTNLHTYAKS